MDILGVKYLFGPPDSVYRTSSDIYCITYSAVWSFSAVRFGRPVFISSAVLLQTKSRQTHLINRLCILNDKTNLEWLNSSFDTFKVNCKAKFLMCWCKRMSVDKLTCTYERVGYIRPNPDDRINKNPRTEFFWPEDQKCKNQKTEKWSSVIPTWYITTC